MVTDTFCVLTSVIFHYNGDMLDKKFLSLFANEETKKYTQTFW